MTQQAFRIARAVWHVLPARWRRALHYTNTGNRFMRFVPVSVAAVAASQLMLAFLVGLAHVTAGTAAVVASITGAAVSYVLSRWAWERRGRPHLLKETLPFWAVSVGAWLVLGVTSHYASVWASSMDLGHWERVGVVNGAYFVANCVTFVTRFAIFHYLLFADRGAKAALPGSVGAAESLLAEEDDGEPLQVARPAASPARTPASAWPAASPGQRR
jgi:putative flippase GtrA